MHWLGATMNELLFVAFLLSLVLVAPKVPKIGERIGGLFDGRRDDKRAPRVGPEE